MNEQYGDCKRLWAMVLLQAIKDIDEKLINWGKWGRKDAHRIKANTVDWVKSDNPDPCSFLWVCQILEIEAAAARKKILSKAQTLPRMERNTKMKED